MDNQILFRADGNSQIGLGHVMRCLALADMLKGHFLMRFAIMEPALEITSKIEESGLRVIPLPASASESRFLTEITAHDVVVFDGYDFDESFQQTVRSQAKKLVFIDDLMTGHQVADVLINHAGGVTSADYNAESYTRFCFGPHYALLRSEFLTSEGFRQVPTDGPIFVSLGGADPHNTSVQVLDAIRQVDKHLPVRLVLGPFHPNRPAVEAYQSQLPNLSILQNLTATQMVTELTQCSLAITSCSTISYEVCAVNRPLISVVTADNQSRLARFLSDEKLALSVHFPALLNQLTPSMNLATALKLAIQSFQFSPEAAFETLVNQRRYFDGRSPERIKDVFNTLADSPS